MPDSTDAVALTKALIRCPSVTPTEGGAITLLEDMLAKAGFRTTRISRGGIENLHARWGEASPVLGFNGHTDVVPVGDAAAWSTDPFGAEEREGLIWGRGATDMKSGVAAFIAAAIRFVQETPPQGSISILITGDEEGEATDGTRAILDWMREAGQGLDACLVGEPTSVSQLGDTIKIGRRGSMSGYLTVRGHQGHTAYPDRAVNPIPVLARICDRLDDLPLDMGSTHFQASTLALTTIDVGNPANNVIPAEARATFNIRFNDLHSSDSVKVWAEQIIDNQVVGSGCEAEVTWKVSGESFLTQPGGFTDIVQDAMTDVLLERPAMTTGGGTSDARFIKDWCPVVEVGLVGDTMHQVDERVPAEDVHRLAEVYTEIMRRFF
ncbi:MAG: succinyl-diaminopimelate desuccinylase [Pseudomonadota bacterium]